MLFHPLRHGDSFYPSSPSLFFIPLGISPLKVTIACYSFCLLRHTNKTCPARYIITVDVFTCTLLHRELGDCSLGQTAFAVFQVLFAITQLHCHVSALLTSACKQVPAERLL